MKILEVIGVTKNFGSLPALKDISFTIKQGEILGLIGPNGAGKTTLVNLIMGSIPFSTGDIHFCGKSIRGLKSHQIGRLGISRTVEVVSPLTKLSLLENVMVGAFFGKKGRERKGRAAQRRAEETLDFMELGAKRDAPVENLNVLERRRLEMAVALALNPVLLLLDEVNAGLNSTEIDEAVVITKRIRDTEVTILVIEHVMQAIAKVSDRILVLQRGKKIIEDAPHAVLNNQEVIKAYLGKRHKPFVGRG